MPVPSLEAQSLLELSFCCCWEVVVLGVVCMAASCPAGPRGQFSGLGKEELCSESTGSGLRLLRILYLVPVE